MFALTWITASDFERFLLNAFSDVNVSPYIGLLEKGNVPLTLYLFCKTAKCKLQSALARLCGDTCFETNLDKIERIFFVLTKVHKSSS